MFTKSFIKNWKNIIVSYLHNDDLITQQELLLNYETADIHFQEYYIQTTK